MAEERRRRIPQGTQTRLFVDGNTVRREEYIDERVGESRQELSYQVRKNRERHAT